MTIRRTFRGSLEEPEEFEYTNPAQCVICGEEHDLDDGEDFREIEGVGIVCDGCHLTCEICGDDLTEKLIAGLIERGGKWRHAECEAEEILASPILRGAR